MVASSATQLPVARQRSCLGLLGATLVAGVCCLQGVQRSFLSLRTAVVRSGSCLVDQPRWGPSKVRGPPPMRLGPGGGADPVNNVSPEMAEAGRKYAQRYEDIFLAGQKLWAAMKRSDEAPKKIFVVGPNGNSGEEVAEAVLDSLAYIPAPDGTYFIRRKPDKQYPKIIFGLWSTDKMLSERSEIAAVDLYMDDEEKYRQIETDIIKEFVAEDFDGHPAGLVVGESALDTPENVELLKNGLVIWVDVSAEWSWGKTQFRPKQGGGLFMPQDFQARPPVWCIANGWDGDIDDAEGKMEYTHILSHHMENYEKVADMRIRTDVAGLAENPHWVAERLMKAIAEHLGLATGDVSVEEEVMEKDLEKFLEGARLSKYLEPALEWCNEQGAATIEDVVENVPEFSEALNLKPLERKRLEKAAATVATTR